MKEEDIIEVLKKENEEFKKLSQEHRKLDCLLLEIDKKAYLTTHDEIERKNMQKMKLAKKDRMAELIREYKKNHMDLNKGI